MRYKIAVCDDDARQREYVQEIVDAWAKKNDHRTDVRQYAGTSPFLFDYAEEKDFDILLLDIEMPQINGIELARTVRKDNGSVQIVFITGFADYIFEGYEVSALHYLMKPVRQDKLFEVLDRAAANLQKTERVILLPVDGETLRLPVSHIQYVEAFSHSVAIVTESETIQVKMSISEMEKMLGEGFVRCHRSYLVGLKYIARLSKTEVILDNGGTLPLSSGAASQVHKAFVSYYT